MKKVAAVLLLVGMTSATAFGGLQTVIFEGPTEVEQGQMAVFDVSLFAATLGDIQGADILLWSDSTAFDFSYSAAWQGAMANVTPSGPGGIFPNDVFVGGNNPAGPIGTNTILFGQVSVDTSGLELFSSHTILVDGEQDFFSQILLGASGEPAVGSGTFRVVPEPASLALLGIGAVALIRRRKTA